MFQIKYNLERSIVINKDLDSVYECVSNFDTWNEWSPWLCLEKNAEVQIGGDAQNVGHKQKWKGTRIGEGEMLLANLEINKSLHYDLKFLKPFKSEAKVDFFFEKQAKGTKLRWAMQSSVPVYLFFLKEMLAAMLGNDFERGLSMLKEFLETGEVLSEIEMLGKKYAVWSLASEAHLRSKNGEDAQGYPLKVSRGQYLVFSKPDFLHT